MYHIVLSDVLPIFFYICPEEIPNLYHPQIYLILDVVSSLTWSKGAKGHSSTVGGVDGSSTTSGSTGPRADLSSSESTSLADSSSQACSKKAKGSKEGKKKALAMYKAAIQTLERLEEKRKKFT